MERIRNILGLTIIALSLTSCTITGSDQLRTNRQQVYGVDCSGSASSISVCYKKAKTLCPNGYNVISRQDTHPMPLGNTLLTDPSTGNPSVDIGVKRVMNIECI
jgi:hypothetical protein